VKKGFEFYQISIYGTTELITDNNTTTTNHENMATKKS